MRVFEYREAAVSSTLRITVTGAARNSPGSDTSDPTALEESARDSGRELALFEHELRLGPESLPLRQRQVARRHDRDWRGVE